MDYSSFNIAKDTEKWWQLSAVAEGINWPKYLEHTSGFCTYDFYNNGADCVLDVKWHPTPMGRINPAFKGYIERGSWGICNEPYDGQPLKKNSSVFSNLDKKWPLLVILQAGWAHVIDAKKLEEAANKGEIKTKKLRLKNGEWQRSILVEKYDDNPGHILSHRMNIELWIPTCKESASLNMNKWMVGEVP